MSIKDKMKPAFRNLSGGLFSDTNKADIGDAVAKFEARGGDNMAWADMFTPDASIPSSVQAATIAVIENGTSAHYTLPIGLPKLREAVARHVHKQTGLNLDPNRNVVITPGSDNGLLFAMMPFIEPDDEVLIFAPSYPSNFLNARLLGGKAISVPTSPEDNYQIPIDTLESYVNDHTKMVVLTHPNNPTTTVYRKENIEQLCAFIVKHDLVLVCDQAFEDHVFDGIEYISPCTLPGMWERTVTVCSLSKGYGLSGYRIAYLYAEEHIMDVLYATTVNVCGAPSTVTTFGAIAALEDETILPTYRAILENRRNLAYAYFGDIPGVKMKKSESGILSWLDISALGTSQEVVTYLMEHANVLVNDGTLYGEGGEGYIRIVSAAFYDDKDACVRFERIRNALLQLAKEKGIIL